MKRFSILLLLFILLITGCSSKKANNNINKDIKDNEHTILNDEINKIRIHYLDVGQGDSTFIELPNDEVMLIDSGELTYKDAIIEYINNLGYKKIDYIIGTHPHSDHIGALSYIIDEYEIGEIYLPKVSTNTNTYLNLLKAIKEKKLMINTAKQGINIIDNDNLKIDILAPIDDNYDNLNNYSVVIRITYNENSFLFMGDAETLVENKINDNVSSDVIKVGHHGSSTSSGIDFIKKVNPKYAIISAGKDNSYGHPHKEIIERYESINAKIYRTDIDGTIILESDGKNININNLNDDIPNDSDIELVSLTEEVLKDDMASIKIKGKANTRYNIKVKYNSGYSKAKGLEVKESDDDGYVEFKWKVSSSVKPGSYRITIENNDCTKYFYFKVK